MMRKALCARLVGALALLLLASPSETLDCRVECRGLAATLDMFTSVKCDGFVEWKQKTLISEANEMRLDSGVKMFGKVGDHGVGIVVIENSDINIVDSVFESLPPEVFEGSIVAPLVINNAQSIVNNSQFLKQNTALVAGGVYVTDNSTATLQNCNFQDNIGVSVGGLMVDKGSTVEVKECTFDSNAAPGWAGAVQVETSSVVKISNSEFTGTHAPPAVEDISELKMILAGHFRGNELPSTKIILLPIAGAMYVNDSKVVVAKTRFYGYSGQRGTMHATGNSTVQLLSVEFIDNFVREGAGVYLGDATADIKDTNFTTNMATKGGALAMTGQGSLSIKGCRFSGNTAISDGGALFVDSSANGGCTGGGTMVQLESTAFVDNDAKGNGGGLLSMCSGAISIKDIVFEENSAGVSGGGIHVSNGDDLAVEDSCFWRNKAINGGGVYAEKTPQASFDSISCLSNVVHGSMGGGGGIAMVGVDKVAIANSFFQYNVAEGDGSALAVANAESATIASTQVNFNEADGNGGGIAASAVAQLLLDNVTVHDNVAMGNGGGLQGSELGVVTLTSTNFTDNEAHTQGGALSLSAVEAELNMTATMCEFARNRGQTGGGAMSLRGGKSADISTSNCSSNVAGLAGAEGGCILTSGQIDVSATDCQFLSNYANSTGGAVSHQGGNLVFKGLALESNTAGGSGGAIASSAAASVELTECTLEKNAAKDGGGALDLIAAEVVRIADVQFVQNFAGIMAPPSNITPALQGLQGVGGAIRAAGVETMDVTNCVFSMNSGDALGGAVHVEGGSIVQMSIVNFTENSCGGAGGALSMEDVLQVSLHSGTFKFNKAHEGAGLTVNGKSAFNGTLLDFKANAANTSGSAVQCNGNATIAVSNSSFYRDTAGYGNGLVAACNCSMTILNSNLTEEQPYYRNGTEGNNTCLSTVETPATHFFFDSPLAQVVIDEKRKNDKHGLIAYFGENQTMVEMLPPAGPVPSEKKTEVSTAMYASIAVGIFIVVLIVLVATVAMGKWVAEAPKYEEDSDSEAGDIEAKGFSDDSPSAPLLRNTDDQFGRGDTAIPIDHEPVDSNPDNFGQSTEDYLRTSDTQLSYTPEPLVQTSEPPVPALGLMPALFGTSTKDKGKGPEIQEA